MAEPPVGSNCILALFRGVHNLISAQSDVITALSDCLRCITIYDSVINTKKFDNTIDEDGIDAALVQCIMAREGVGLVLRQVSNAETEWALAHQVCFGKETPGADVLGENSRDILSDYEAAMTGAIESLTEEFPEEAPRQKVRDIAETYFDISGVVIADPGSEYGP